MILFSATEGIKTEPPSEYLRAIFLLFTATHPN